jgi:hypothetical protein
MSLPSDMRCAVLLTASQMPCQVSLTGPGNLYQLNLESSRTLMSRVKTADLCREHEINAATFYQRKQKFGGMDVSLHPFGSTSFVCSLM